MIIEGLRIYLRPFEVEDAKWVQEIRNDFDSIKNFAGNPFPSNLVGEKEWISKMYPPGERKSIYFAIIDKESDQFSGYVNARNINYINRNAEVGGIIHKNARRKGYYKDARITFYNYLFTQINLHKLYSTILSTNEISIEKSKILGFEVEGLIKEHVFQDGVYKDVYFVSLYKNKFYETVGPIQR